MTSKSRIKIAGSNNWEPVICSVFGSVSVQDLGQMSSYKIHSELLLQHLDYSCCFTLTACSEKVMDMDYGAPSQLVIDMAFRNPSKEDYHGE